MALQISNYGELKAAVQNYLNRNDADTVSRIPLFIALAERKIFRQLRAPMNERIVDYTPTPGGGPITYLQLPEDYLESKLMYSNFELSPLVRISEQQYRLALGGQGVGRGRATAPGQPRYFARVGNTLNLYPIPDDGGTNVEATEFGRAYQLYYWQDQSGLLDEDTDFTSVLRQAPDLYLYGALLEAQPYIKNDERIAVWAEMFRGTLELVNSQRDEAEYSGSNVGVSNAVNGAYGD